MEGTISLAGISISGTISHGDSLTGELNQSVVNIGIKLLPATKATLGGVIVGDNLSVDPDGKVSAVVPEVNKATKTTAGIVSVGNGLDVDSNGTISVGDISDKIPAVPKATKSAAGAVIVGDNLNIDENGVLSASPSASIVVDSVMNSTSANPVQNKVINSALTNKVDKQSGKGLSTNDFTAAYKNKLDGLNDYTEMTAADIASGTSTTAQVISPNVLATAVDTKISAAVAGLVVPGAAVFKSAVNANSDISSLASYKKGWYWVVATAGTYIGQSCEPGDMIFCVSDRATAYNVNDFTIVQNNIVAISNSEIDTITA